MIELWLYKRMQITQHFLQLKDLKALRHTINGMVYMIHYLLNNNTLDYILFGR